MVIQGARVAPRYPPSVRQPSRDRERSVLPTPSKAARRIRQQRAAYTRTNGNLLINDPGIPDPDGPSGMAPVYWLGLDSGGGAHPIGPNGPYPYSGPAIPVVTRATSLIVSPLTAAPYRVEDMLKAGVWYGSPRWLSDPMLMRPDARFPQAHPAVARMPRAKFWADWIRSAIWWGEGAFLAAEDATGAPLAGSLKLVNPLLLETERDDNGVLVWAIASENHDPDGRAVFDREGRITFGSVTYRLFVLRNPHSDVDSEGRALGVFGSHPGVFGLARQMESYTSGTFRSGIPAGYLKVSQPHLSQTAADDLKASWLRNHGGDRRSIAVLNATTEFHPLNLSPVDAALGEVKRLNIADVAFAFGLDPITLGAGLNNSATYTNIRDAWSNHADFGLAPWIAAVEDTLSALVPINQAVRVNLDHFANPAPGERYAAYSTAINAGILTANEARDMEGLPPLPAPTIQRPPRDATGADLSAFGDDPGSGDGSDPESGSDDESEEA
jgi:hypothetical protein